MSNGSCSLQSLQNLYNLFICQGIEIESGTSVYRKDIIEPLIAALKNRIDEYHETLKIKGSEKCKN